MKKEEMPLFHSIIYLIGELTDPSQEENTPLLKKIIRTCIFFVLIFLSREFVNISSDIFNKSSTDIRSILGLISEIVLMLLWTLFARSVIEFLVCFLLFYLTAFSTIELTNNKYANDVGILYVFLAGLAVYLMVQAIHFIYREFLSMKKKTRPQNAKNFKNDCVKVYERLHSNFDHASNVLAVAASAMLAISKLEFIQTKPWSSFFFWLKEASLNQLLFAATYIAIIKFCASIMKRNIIKFKDKDINKKSPL